MRTGESSSALASAPAGQAAMQGASLHWPHSTGTTLAPTGMQTTRGAAVPPSLTRSKKSSKGEWAVAQAIAQRLHATQRLALTKMMPFLMPVTFLEARG
jgi:hypothetical protein